MHTVKHKQALIARVKRISGQMAAIERALDEEADCTAVLHQVSAVRGAVLGLMDELIEGHLHDHVARPGLDDAERAVAADALMEAIRRYGK